MVAHTSSSSRGFSSDIGDFVAAPSVDVDRAVAGASTRDRRPSANADLETDPSRWPTPFLVSLDGPLVVRIIRELKKQLLAYRGPEELDEVDEFLRQAKM